MLFRSLVVVVILIAVVQSQFPKWVQSISIFVASHNFIAGSSDQNSVISYDPLTGNTLWATQISPGDGNGEPFVCDDTHPELVFAVTSNAYGAVNRSSGRLVWSLPMDIPNTEPNYRLCPAAPGVPLIIANPTMLFAVDAATGMMRHYHYFNFTFSVHWLSGCGPNNHWCIVVTPFANMKQVIAVDSITGTIVSSFVGSLLLQRTSGNIIIAASVGTEPSTSGLYWNGTVAWTSPYEFTDGTSDLWAAAGYNGNGSLAAFSVSTGKLLWNTTNICGFLNVTQEDSMCSLSVNLGAMVTPLLFDTYDTPSVTAGMELATGNLMWVVNGTFTPQQSTRYTQYSTTTACTVLNVLTHKVVTFDITNYYGPVLSLFVSDSLLIMQTAANAVAYPIF